MERYHLNLRNDVSADDPEGLDFPDVNVARARAGAYALDMSANSILETRKLNLRYRIEVTTGAGHVVLTVEFGDVVKIES